MKEIVTTITQRSQVTIPAEVRRVLGVKPRDKVAFTIEDGGVRLAPAPFSLESAYGSVKPVEKPENFEEISRAAKEAKAEKTVRALHNA
ncbi:MAG: type II toxin-antitoxin system PrlF family antitoxin [Nitrospira sp.]|nr:type II toxin-antitoxin system PrlF family antitoxin [Nitrospira sp.]